MRGGDARDRPRAADSDTARSLQPLPLAQGELDPRDARELQELKAQIRMASGFFCEGYKEKCLRRRIAVRMRARGMHRYGDYGELLKSDAVEMEKLLAAVTINVTKFFRNPEVWEAVRRHVVPELFAIEGTEIRLWSAGCASGEEAYTMAILLREYAEAQSRVAELERFRILGTDIDRDAVEEARRAEYAEMALQETPAEPRARWFAPVGKGYRLDPAIAAMVRFEPGDLLAESAPEEQHVILCRNVIIYFERPVQETLFARFARALVPGGFLLLGKVETMFGPAAARFRTLSNAERLMRRI